MSTVVQHKVGLDRTLDMTIELDSSGALVTLEGDTGVPCWCQKTHLFHMKAVLRVKPEAKHRDHEDLEGALRGDDDAAQALAWRFTHLLFFNQPHPKD